jgi:transposase-like protein
LILLIRLFVTDARLEALVDRHGEDGCRVYLEQLRWPGGVRCPRCDSSRTGWLEARRKHNCRDCRYQFRVTARTLLHDSHVPLSTWLVAVSAIVASERGYPATRLQDLIGGSYKTAWFVEHRIRAAMARPGEIGPIVALRPGGAAWDGIAHDVPADRAAIGAGAPPGWTVLRRTIAGPYRNPSTKYLSAYWNEARWRAAHGRDAAAFRDTVTALLRHPPLPYGRLVAA